MRERKGGAPPQGLRGAGEGGELGWGRPSPPRPPPPQGTQPRLTRLLQPCPVAQGVGGLLVRRVGAAVVVMVVEGVRAAAGRPGVGGVRQGSAVGDGGGREGAAVEGLLLRRRVQGLQWVGGRQAGRVLRLRLVRRRRGPQPEVQEGRLGRVRGPEQALGERVHRHHSKGCGTGCRRPRRREAERARAEPHPEGYGAAAEGARAKGGPRPPPDSLMPGAAAAQHLSPSSDPADRPPPSPPPRLATSRPQPPLPSFSQQPPPAPSFLRAARKRERLPAGTVLPRPLLLLLAFHLSSPAPPAPIGPRASVTTRSPWGHPLIKPRISGEG